MSHVLFISIGDKAVLGVRSISSFLEQQGYSTSIIYFKEYNQTPASHIKSNMPLKWHFGINQYGKRFLYSYPSQASEKELKLLLLLIKQNKPSLVCFTLSSFHMPYAARLSQEIKIQFNIPIVWGGPGPTMQSEEAIQYCDIVCVGEGEMAMLDLIRCITQKKNYSNIKNLWIKQKGRVIKNRLRPLIQNLDKLPFPNFAIDGWRIDGNQLLRDCSYNNFQDIYATITSRGCPFSCSYCCNGYYKRLYHGQRYVRRLSVENVIKELIEAKQKLKPKFIMFYDEVFTTDKEWLECFVELYKELINLPFWCNLHPQLVDEYLLKRLRSCGLKQATLGIQSGSECITKEIYNRDVPNEKIVKTAYLLKKLKINYLVDIITNCPFEKDEDCRATLNLLLQLPRPFLLTVSELSIFPKSDIEEKSKKQGSVSINMELFNFYNKLYYMASFWLIPKFLVQFISKRSFIKTHSALLNLFFIFPQVIMGAKRLMKKVIPSKVWFKIKYQLR